ncbi:transcriptional regulator, partial [Striga asiatica]
RPFPFGATSSPAEELSGPPFARAVVWVPPPPDSRRSITRDTVALTSLRTSEPISTMLGLREKSFSFNSLIIINSYFDEMELNRDFHVSENEWNSEGPALSRFGNDGRVALSLKKGENI